MKKLYQKLLTLGLMGLLFMTAGNVMGQDLIISQYTETNSGTSPKGVELWNVSGSTIDFAVTGLVINKGNNGDPAASDFELATGTLAAGAVMVVGTSNMGTYLTSEGLTTVLYQDKGFTFNGNDALEIVLGGVTQDIFGTIGDGSTWSGSGVSSSNQNIQLKSGITVGDTDGWTDPSERFETVSTDPVNDLTGFGLAPVIPCTAPSTQATFAAASAISDNGLTLNPTRGDGDGVIILAKEGAAVDAAPASGTTYTANAAFSNGDEIGTGNFVVFNGAASGASTAFTQAITSLLPGTEYHFAAYEYNTTDVCYAGTPATISATTTTSLATDSNIEAPTTQVAAGNISSVANAVGDAVDVFTFKLTDSNNGDAVATDVNTIVIEKGTNNTVADWSAVIEGAVLNDGTADLTVTSTTVNADNITFDLTGNEYSIASNTSEELTLSVYLKTSVTDGEVLAFEIPTAHSFDADALGSTFTNPIASAITSNDHTIAVVATTFDLNTVSAALVNSAFSVEASAVDANGNVDLATRNITLSKASGTGALAASALAAQAMTDGMYTWSDVTLDAQGDYTLAVDDDASALTATTSSISVLGNLYFTEEFDYTDATSINGQGPWVSFSGTADDMMVTTPSLEYALYPETGTGNAVKIVEGGSEDVTADLPAVNNGSVYFSALVNVSDAVKPDASGEYFLLTRESGGSFGTRIYVKDEGGILRFGITKNSGSVEYTTADYNYGETYLIAVKYTFNSGTGDDDVMDFWVNPTIDGIEPTPTLTHSATMNDKVDIAAIALRQSGGTGDVLVDGIRVANTWADLLPAVCTPPSTQASNVTFGATDETSMVINWTKGDGDAVLVLLNEGSAAEADVALDTDYSSLANTDFSAASVINGTTKVVYAGATAETVTVTGLTQGTTYHVAVIEYNAANFCYNTAAPARGSKATTTPNDATTTVVAADAPIAAATLTAAAVTTEEDAVAVFNFKVVDDAATDSENTSITALTIDNANATLWTEVLAGVKITNGEDTVAVTSITDTALEFDFSSPFIVENGGNTTLTILAWFNTVQVDGTELAFEIPTAHSFVADAAGSIFVSDLAAAITSATHTIDVVATELAIAGAPSSVQIANAFGFTVTAEDANGNVDTAARSLTASTIATGVLGGSVAATAMTNGVLTYTDLTYDTEGAFTVAVTDGALTATTASINAVAEVNGGLLFSEYFEGSGNNKYVEIYNATGAAVDLSTVAVKQSNNGSGFDGHPTDPAAYSITLEGTLAAGDVYIVYNGQSDIPEILAEGDTAFSYGNNPGDRIAAFNGDDAMGLFVNGILVDLIGDPAVDPGSSWDVAGVTGGTGEHTLVRKTTITEGNTTALGSFGTTAENSEWVVYDQNTVTYIGFAGELTDPTISAITANFNGDFGFVANGSSSDASSYIVSAVNLTTDLVITAPAGFELSLASDFATPAATLTLAPTAGDVAETTVYVRFTPTAADGAAYSGDIAHTSTDATTVNLAVSGTEGSLALSDIADIRGLAAGSIVKVTGTIIGGTNHSSASRVLQDNTAGITLRGFNFPTAALVVGDSIVVEGTLSEFANLLQLEPTAAIQVIAQGKALPEPQVKTIPEIGENDESELVLVQNVRFVETGVFAGGGADGNFRVANDAGDTIAFRLGAGDHPLVGMDIPTEYVNITAWVGQFNDDYQISPETAEDVEIIAITEPTLTVSAPANGFDFGTVLNNNTSAAQSFTLSADLLVADVVVTAPAEFEVSTSETDGFGASLTLAVDSEGNLPTTSIYVRFAPIANTGATFTGDVTIVSADESASIAVTGTEEALIPAITVTSDVTTFDFGSVESGKVSAPESFTVAGINLSGDIVVTAPAGYKVALNSDGEFKPSVNAIANQEGIVEETTIFVVFAPTVTGTINGDVSITSGELAETLAVTGTATEAIPTANKKALSGVKAYPNPTNGLLQVELSNTNTFTYQLIRLDGSVIQRGTANQSTSINIAGIKTGLYLIEVVQGDKVFRTRIVKN